MKYNDTVHVAFVWNPNCGKTTLFNAITGSKLKVANWPGVTVEKIEGEAEYEEVCQGDDGGEVEEEHGEDRFCGE